MRKENLQSYLRIGCYFIILIFIGRIFQFELFAMHPFVQKIYANLSRIIFVFILIYWVKHNIFKEKLNNIILILILIYFSIVLCSTITNEGNMRSVISASYPVIGSIMAIQIGIKKDFDIFFKAIILYFYIFILINFLDMIFFKDLNKDVYFFIGGRNQLAISLATGFCFLKIYKEKYNTLESKILFYTYHFFIIFIAIRCKSATCAISMMVLMILNYFKFLRKLITPLSFFISYSMLWLGIVFFNVQNYFKFFIENIFHKNVTLSARTYIWEEALTQIKDSFLLGYGTHQDADYFQIKSLNGTVYYFSGHNQIIQQLYESGFISVVFFFIIYFYCLSNKKRDENFYCLFNTIITIFITWLTEAPGVYAMLTILAFCYYSDYIGERRKL